MKKISLFVVIVFLQQALTGICFAEQNKTANVSQSKKDSILRQERLLFNHDVLINTYNYVVGNYNKYSKEDKLTCAKMMSISFNKLNLVLANKYPLPAKEVSRLKSQNFGPNYSLTVAEADKIIASNNEAIKKINLFLKNVNDKDAFNALDNACRDAMTEFQTSID